MIYEQTVVLTQPFDEAVEAVKAAFAAEGFGTLTEIDMQAALAEKIGAEITPYVIIGACNPKLANRALEAEPRIGVLLPCNVVVRADGDAVVVEAMDPQLMATIVGDDAIAPIAGEARERVSAALDRLLEGTSPTG